MIWNRGINVVVVLALLVACQLPPRPAGNARRIPVTAEGIPAGVPGGVVRNEHRPDPFASSSPTPTPQPPNAIEIHDGLVAACNAIIDAKLAPSIVIGT